MVFSQATLIFVMFTLYPSPRSAVVALLRVTLLKNGRVRGFVLVLMMAYVTVCAPRGCLGSASLWLVGSFALARLRKVGVSREEGAARYTLGKEVAQRAALAVLFDVDEFVFFRVQVAQLDAASRAGVATGHARVDL
jgi:hypothetical protein